MTEFPAFECSAFKSAKKEGLYVFTKKGAKLEELLPPSVAQQVGELTHFYDFELHPARKMQREHPQKVIENIQTHGFHIQMPAPDPLDRATDTQVKALADYKDYVEKHPDVY
jgi:uncharacterized protein YcgL (UPF0745 family)